MIDEKDSEESYRRILPELLALPPHRLRPVKEDIPRAVSVVLGAVKPLRALRPRIAVLAEFDVTRIDRLEDYALGLQHAHSLLLGATKPRDQLPRLLQEATTLKDRFVNDSRALASRGVIHLSPPEKVIGRKGYAQVATELRSAAAVLKNNWPLIEGQCGVTLDELEYAEKLALRMDRLRGLRGNPPKSPRDEAADIRTRAYTVLVEAYEQAQRAVDFLLWDDPTRASVTPTLFRGRPRKGDSKAVEKNLGGA